MSLTDAAVRRRKPKSKRIEVADGQGLYLAVHPTGRKSWVMRYRDPMADPPNSRSAPATRAARNL